MDTAAIGIFFIVVGILGALLTILIAPYQHDNDDPYDF